ncbi:Uncharacterised protein [Mycobacterium tuberculosis]|uniref:Uncharacterized protein n=1 Tax=Mycobacterium tuberculosis TaxID=1773 RepID=A0A0T7LXW9_MYCTX|nr:Uncharacterised protein [Mycobacterium tuberculosis]CFE65602.1 Uncharacterised protein [Mycobacterium tuberculosis]CFR85070.1 Uncharacterised protein [Mycobacterium tuberculosis]CKR45340.1 Uncharacterised protein [Mycobacterium tuberculosis]CKS87747.1 Uncharacterised protein [Mycobacterium tuberculosis]
MAGADIEHPGGILERPLNLGAGRVATRVHDASPRVPAFARQRPTARDRFIQPCPSSDQIGNRSVAVGDDRVHRIGIA